MHSLDHVADDTVSLARAIVFRRRTVSENLERWVSLNVLFTAEIVLNGTVDFGNLNVIFLESGGGNLILRC
jgi:hypothetical protein